MVKVENLKAIEGGKAVEIEYLGSLLWMSVSNSVKIKAPELEMELKGLGLEEFMPRKINPRDAFRRATRDVEVKREQYGEGTYINLLVRPVKTVGEVMVRQLVREVVDGQNTQLAYEPVVQFEIRDDGTHVISPLVADLHEKEQSAMESVGPLYEEAMTTYEGDHLRRLIERVLNKCAPISVRPSGGVHFIPQKHVDDMDTLKVLVKKLASYEEKQGATRIWSVPVIDAEEHREMVEESLENQVMDGTLNMIEEMKKLVQDSSREVQTTTIQQYVYQIKKMNALVGDYEEMLEFQATQARENLELAHHLAMKLMGKVEA